MGKRNGIQNRAAAVFLAAACLCGSFTQPCSIYAQESTAADGILESDAGTGPQAGTADTVSGSAIRNDSMEPETAVENSTGTEDGNRGEPAGGEYTDSSGVVFKYRTDSGEADIYQISGCPGKDVSIPGEVDGFTVTRLTAEMGNISVSSLTIPETVVYVAENAFRSARIGTLYYNAADAADIEGTGASGPFGYAQIGDLQIGTGVKAIPGKMFAGAVFQQESILLDVHEIRDAAFYSAEFKEVTIGENVASISGGTFRYAKMEKLNYNAASAQTDKTDGYVQAAFFNAEIGELEIGGEVEKLPYGFMAGAKVSQDSLTIPDSVASIESYAFFAGMSPGDMSFGTLTIGKNAERLGDYIFGNCRIGHCVINLLKAPSSMTSYVGSQPECGSLVSHNLGTYFNYFKAKTDKENVTVLCKDFKTDRWPEYYNEEKGCFAQMVEVSCTECGHTERSYEYSDAFTVVFTDHDGAELSRQHLHPGEDAAAPEEAPEREGWKFTGWDKDFTNVSENLTVTAQYEAVRYTVTFKCGDETVSIQEIPHGGAAKAPDAPKREGHKFTGWDADFSNITGDLTVTAQYKAESYTVLFFDGTKEISRQYVDYGCAAKAPENPSRPDEAWGRWVFTGWDGAYQNVTKDETVYACFEKSLNQYKVIFYDAYGKAISTQAVEYGGKAEAPEAPEKAADAQYAYIFQGWDADTENITADTAFHPVYESRDIGGSSGSAKTYTVTFMDGNTVIDIQKVEAGKDASVPKNPSRPGEAWGKWIFTGWKGRYKNVAADETVYACFEKKLNEYKAVFYDAYGNIISIQTVEHGGKAETPEAPEKAADAQHTYIFKKWDADTWNITADTAFHPVYESRDKDGSGNGGSGSDGNGGSNNNDGSNSNNGSDGSENARTYTVTFMDGDTVLDVQKVEAGKDASAQKKPSRPDEEWGKWRFTGWKGNYKNVTKDETVYAYFEKKLNKYKVIFYDAAGNAVSAQTVKYAGSAKVPKAPEKAPDAKRIYIFKCWDADTENITADTSFHPVYKAKARTYTVTFMDGKKTLGVQNVKYGSAAKAPKKPVKKADGKYVYKFAGWDADFGFITKDTVIHALFDAKENSNADKTADQKKDTGKDTDKGNSTDKNNGGGTDKRNHKGTGSSKNADKDNNIQKNSGNNAGGTAVRGTEGVASPGNGRKTGSSGYTADSGKKTGIGTGKGNPRTGNGNLETAGKTEPSVQRPAAGESAQKQERQAGSRASSHTQGKAATGSSRSEKETASDNKIVQEKTEEKMDEDSNSGGTADDTGGSVKGQRNPGGSAILLFLFAGALSAAAFAWLYLRAFRKYRVTGMVCNADGNPVSGAHILLSGEKTLETCTDGQGKFCFDGIGKGIRQLEVWLDGDSAQLSMDIRVGEQDAGKAFRIRSSHCVHVGHALEKDGYAVNVSL